MWVYKCTNGWPVKRDPDEPLIYTVGFYDPDGKWHPDSDHVEQEKAAARVAWLNGGNAPQTAG